MFFTREIKSEEIFFAVFQTTKLQFIILNISKHFESNF